MPVPPLVPDSQSLIDRLALPHIELEARPIAVPQARRYVTATLWDVGLKEFIEPVELIVSELITNAVRASGGLDAPADAPQPGVRLWLIVEGHGVFVLVWDGCPSLPEQQAPGPDAESGRGLFLVNLLSAAWGSFEIADEPGKVVWALCQR